MTDVSAVAAVNALDACNASGRGLRIEFFRLSDRYAHRILAVGCEELPVVVLESVEGAADDPWPPSPAFQALSVEDLQASTGDVDPSRSTMLVGMSGTTHWSMSVSPLSELNLNPGRAPDPGFYFDAAARLKSVPKVLSTRYSVGKRVRAQQSGNVISLYFGSGQARLDSLSGDRTYNQDSWQLDKWGHELRHELAPNHSQLQLPTTIRWRYSARLLNG